MKTENILNTLILTLSVSTVLITLVSYLIYKMRQFPKSNKEIKEATKKEGTFFRRHIPGEAISEVPSVQEEIKKSRLARFNTLPYYFGLLVFIIFSSLIFKDVFTGMIDSWKRNTQIDKIHNLKEKNLLNLYELDVNRRIVSLQEFIPESSRQIVSEKVNSLQTQKITLLVWANNKKLNSKHLDKSLSGWIELFKKHQLVFTQSDSTEDFNSDIYILPQAKSISGSQKKYLNDLVKRGKSLLFTGPCGIFDGTGGKSPAGWCETNLSLKFLPNDETSPSKPTLFAARRNPGWMIPPGYLISWLPEDESFATTSIKQNEASSYEANFNGKLIKDNKSFFIRSLFQKTGNSKIGWLAVEPHGLGGKPESEVFHGESAIIDSLSWLSGKPHIEIGNWKYGEDHGLVISVDSESEIEGAFSIWKVLKDTKTPGTFFVVSDQLKNDDRLTKINSPLFDLGSHSLDHSILSTKKLDFQFNNIQDSRMILEEKFGRAVKGFHPPEERFNEDTINASLQNHFEYFVGDQRFFRMAPLFIDSKLIYFPRVFKDDVLIKKNRGLVSNDDVRQVMNEELAEARFLGGIYYFNTHSQVFGQGFYLEVLKEFLEQKFPLKPWKTSLGDLVSWWKDRSQLKLQIMEDRIVLKTSGKVDLENLVIYLAGKAHKITVPAGDKGVSLKFE